METHLIAIGVDETKYAKKLNCCIADARLIELTCKNLYHIDNVQVFEDFNAQTNLINDYINLKVEELKEGGNLIIYFSGHGGQVDDYNKDEKGKYDSTLCFRDRMLLDDEMFIHFCKFSALVNIFFISDSCHSGTVYRDTEELVIPEGAKFLKGSIEVGKQWKHIYEKVEKLPEDSLRASLFFLSACSDEEYAYTDKPNSLFTTKLVKQLTNEENEDMTFEELAEMIIMDFDDRADLTPKYKIFGNGFKDQKVKALLTKKNTKHLSWDGEILLTSDMLEKAEDLLREKGFEYFDDLDERTTSFFLNPKEHSIKAGTLIPYLQELNVYFNEQNIQVFLEPELSYDTDLPQEKSSDGHDRNSPIKNWAMPGWPIKDVKDVIDPLDLYKKTEYTALNDALLEVENRIALEARKVRIAIIDTGFLEAYPSRPINLREDLGRSFVKGEDEYNFSCKNTGGNNAFHGIATTTLLAGSSMKTPEDGIFKGEEKTIGACPYAEVIPIRIANDVVIWGGISRALCRALDYIMTLNVDVISMSMGGAPSNPVLYRINALYNKGVVIVTAAGNNFKTFGDFMIPEEVIYPSRHNRVITACGVSYNNGPYDFDAQKGFPKNFKGGEHMQGNSGPAEVMKYALAAYTPNIPWASVNMEDDGSREDYLSIRGGGTSSATPQIAAAAALYITYHRKELEKLPYDWMKAEAVRKALFESADENKYEKSEKYYGNGVLNARRALDIKVPDSSTLVRTEADELPPLTLFRYLGLYF